MRNGNSTLKCIRIVTYASLLFSFTTMVSCKKYLDEKPKQSLTVPSTLDDMRALLDNQIMNAGSPALLEFVADNYYLTNSALNGAGIDYRSTYSWDGQAQPPIENWSVPYNAVYNANFILDYLPDIKYKATEQSTFNDIEGEALFFRAFVFYQIAQMYCKPYSSTANTDAGIVLRLTANVTGTSTRATVQQTYDQVIKDLQQSVELLPATSLFTTRPNKIAAYALLARVYLTMRDYANALTYSDRVFAEKNTLLDYNTLTPSANSYLPGFAKNPEIIFLANSFYYLLAPGFSVVDSTLYQSYNNNDLRKTVFFGVNAGLPSWKGCYFPDNVTHGVFNGLATDEISLIRAECLARSGDKDNAMIELNRLMRNRWKNTSYTDMTAVDATDALSKVLIERRKELLFRGLRWPDLRRLNQDGANISLKRVANGTTYILPPNDARWVLLIPPQEITQSGIDQNPR